MRPATTAAPGPLDGLPDVRIIRRLPCPCPCGKPATCLCRLREDLDATFAAPLAEELCPAPPRE